MTCRILILIIAFTPSVWSQSNRGDDFLSADLKAAARNNAMPATMLAVGLGFLGRPYVGHTLEVEGPEGLVVNLQQFDCFTFLETVIAMAAALKTSADEATFRSYLQRVRYRGGLIDGYPSRLHYTSDWLFDNEQKGFLVVKTRSIGGIRDPRNINFMTGHRSSYSQLADDRNFARMGEIERHISQRQRFFVPKGQVAAKEDLIHDGDILAITTSIKGLDVVHVGLAIRPEGKRLHMLHASLGSKKVEVTEHPLADYLARHKHQTGIMVARPLKLPPMNDR